MHLVPKFSTSTLRLWYLARSPVRMDLYYIQRRNYESTAFLQMSKLRVISDHDFPRLVRVEEPISYRKMLL